MTKLNCVECNKEIKTGQKPWIIKQQIYCNKCGAKKNKIEEKLDKKVLLKMRGYDTIETFNTVLEHAEKIQDAPKKPDKEFVVMEEDMEKLFARFHVYQKGGDLVVEKGGEFFKVQPHHKFVIQAHLNQSIELDRDTMKKRWGWQ